MIQLPEDRRPPMTPQLALRVTVVGTVALALFAILFFRLWFLQVLSGDQYLRAATVNRVRDVAIAAPRGEIKASDGSVLVGSTKALEVQISAPDLPHTAGGQAVVFRRLAHVLKISTKKVRCRVAGPPPAGGLFHLAKIPCEVKQQLAILPYADVDIQEVNKYVQYYLAENEQQFRGVQVSQIYIPSYPQGDLGAQLLGTVGRITAQECWGSAKPSSAPLCSNKAYRGVDPNAVIGQSGLEGEYDRYLRGIDGSERVQIDAFGQPTRNLSTMAPIPGHNLALSLNTQLQRVGQQALANSIASNPGADAGSFVAMNPVNGQIYAMGSYPTFNPSIFTKPVSDAEYKALTNPNGGDPLLNRAIQSAGPTGSTFKPITATAALESGAWSVGDIFDDTGQFCFSGQCRHNAGNAVDGSLDLVNAIRVSSDDFFYNLGVLTNADPATHPNGGPLDHWARLFGIGRATGVDLPGEVSGTLPTPRWRASRNKLEAECDSATGPFRYTDGTITSAHMHRGWHRSQKHVPGGCGIADGTNRPWSVGDNENLAVGQGDVQVTPLQLAVAYSALANGGTVITPHLGLNVQNADGTVLQQIDPAPARHISIDPFYRQTILDGMHDAAQTAGGTSDDVMGNFPEYVYGKTGTAQYTGQPDYAWYACFVTATSKPILVVVHVERGGFGDISAAPVARQILSQWFFDKPGVYKSGTSATL
ncbi:MAG: penicillin-binding transpeptidase domain-containing protein [Solirubrobacteraceae bacterium]